MEKKNNFVPFGKWAEVNGKLSCNYDNPNDEVLALFCLFNGYDLSVLDAFLEKYSEKNSPAFQELMVNRLLARDGVKYLPNTEGGRSFDGYGKSISVLPHAQNGILKCIQFILMRARENGLYPEVIVGKKTIGGRKKGGIKTAAIRKSESDERNQKIVSAANKLLEEGRAHRDLVGILEKKFGLSKTKIRTALNNKGILKKSTLR